MTRNPAAENAWNCRSQFALVPVFACNRITACPLPPTENSLTLTFAAPASDPSAAIYTTTDGSFPGPGNAAAALYGAPFAVAGGTVIRWAAYAAGKLGSSTAMATVT